MVHFFPDFYSIKKYLKLLITLTFDWELSEEFLNWLKSTFAFITNNSQTLRVYKKLTFLTIFYLQVQQFHLSSLNKLIIINQLKNNLI